MALTHYETLGVPQNASKAEITAAFRAQMRALHGDAGGNDELAKHVSSAYNVLSNSGRRAKYNRTLGPQPLTTPQRTSNSRRTNSSASEPSRRRVFHPETEAQPLSMLSVDPSQWSWYSPAGEDEAVATEEPDRRRHFRAIFLVVAFAVWAAAGAAAATTLGLPLVRIGALSVPLALMSGVGAHLVWSLLVITRTAWTGWGLAILLGIAAAASLGIYLDAGTPLPALGSVLCLGATLLTTVASFGTVLSQSARNGRSVIDSSFITQVGATLLGSRHADIDQLLGALTGAFGHRDGVRVILLPDRVTPRPGVSPVRSQIAVVVGRSVHLIAIPPLGTDGMEVSASEVTSDGQVHRNVVCDEVQALRGCYGRGADVHGYVVPTQLSTAPPAIQQVNGVSFGSLMQVIDVVGTDAGSSLDRPNTLFRHRALESMSLLA